MKIRILDLKLVFLLTLLVFFIFNSTLSAGQVDIPGEEILSNIEKKYTGKSFQADFKQISKLTALDIVETATGKAWFSHPGKMRWLYLTPERHEIITNGNDLWIFRPDQDQVMRGDAKKFFKAGTGGAFLSDIGLMRENFTIETIETEETNKTDETHVTLLLTAKQKNPDMDSITIKVSSKTHEIQQVTTHNAYGDTTMFEFSNIQFNQIDESVFEFKVPDGLNIIDMD